MVAWPPWPLKFFGTTQFPYQVIQEVSSYLVSKLGHPNGQTISIVERVGVVDNILSVGDIGMYTDAINLEAKYK